MLTIGNYTFTSRLLLGTGKYPNADIQREAVKASETNVLTFALSRIDLDNIGPDPIEQLDRNDFTLLPNTAGAKTAEEAVRLARLARSSGICDMIKVEVIGDPPTLLPDPVETLKATEILLAEGFTVLPYLSDDPMLALRAEQLGAHAIMPGASPIGSGLGITNPYNLQLIIEKANVPVIVDAGVGAHHDAAEAMQYGADAVLLNSAVSKANDPVKMAEAMKLAIQAGRLGFEAGRIPAQKYASASSPQESWAKK
ncbi:LOW QUALITY PROTEIN: thiazole biosynthesis protein ThiG [Geomicrobium sp. JCM 19039]|nr:LOW QUALITY PROTEIN: thiazole biosynthesis protein ThiG [Geomicrobium sp. JCM 19039]